MRAEDVSLKTMSLLDEHAESEGHPDERCRGGLTIVRTLTICALLALGVSGCLHKYGLPTGDGEPDYSPPSLQGRITAVDTAKITVMAEAGETVDIETPSDTRFYKLAGGVVLRQELVAGHRVRVWFVQHKPPYMPPRAAVVMLASLDPGDDWPK